jgi:hypothetical protein
MTRQRRTWVELEDDTQTELKSFRPRYDKEVPSLFKYDEQALALKLDSQTDLYTGSLHPP